MFKFLHIADVHLGFRQYKLLERERDFARAFDEAVQLGLKHNIDFAVIAGDLFHQRNISPQTYRNAVKVLQRFRDAQIPVFAIEGNHDLRDTGSFNSHCGSWYEALAFNGLIHFLYPDCAPDGSISLPAPNKGSSMSGYWDLKIRENTIRIIGSRWHGSKVDAVLNDYAEAMAKISSGKTPDYTIFMFHGGHENSLPVDKGGFPGGAFKPLLNCVDYVALGHIHKHYIEKVEGKTILYNPGSTEANNLAEVGIKRGVLLVTVKGHNASVELLSDYPQRQFVLLPAVNAEDFMDLQALLDNLQTLIEATLSEIDNVERPIVHCTVKGQAPFEIERSAVDNLRRKLEDSLVLHLLIKWDLANVEFTFEEGEEGESKLELERSILQQMLAEDANPEHSLSLVNKFSSIRNAICKESTVQQILDAF